MWQQYFFTIGPLFDPIFLTFDAIGCLCIDGISGGHLHSRRQYLLQGFSSVLGKHVAKSAWRTGGSSSKRTVFRRKLISLALKKSCGCARWGYAHGVYADYFFCLRIVDQGLCFTTPTEYVPHRTGGRQHGTGCIHCIATILKNSRTGCSRQGFTRDGHPMLGVQGWFLCALGYGIR